MSYSLSLYGTPINSKISQVCQQFLSTILTLHKPEEVWSIVYKLQTN